MTKSSEIYTIGHSTLPIESFVKYLKSYGVATLYDVRTTPFSKFQPQYNKDTLSRTLGAAEIQYVFAGETLGGRSNRESDYVDNQVVYSRMKENPKFSESLDQITRQLQESNIALMCSEKDPLDCHRTLLIAEALVERGYSITHILSDGSSETHQQSISRLLKISKLDEEDLFQNELDRIREAFEKQEKAIAYKRPSFLDAV